VTTTDIGVLASSLMQGRVLLDADVLKQLRHSRQLSQDELANECSIGHFRVSISSIKRAETGKPVLFRIARELARFFNVPAQRLICGKLPETHGREDVIESIPAAHLIGDFSANRIALPQGKPFFPEQLLPDCPNLRRLQPQSEPTDMLDAHVNLNETDARYDQRDYVDALSLADKALSLGGPITARYELNRLKGLLLKLLGLPEKSIECLLEAAGLARDDGERCDAWCALADAYLCVNRRGEAENAMWQAQRYAALSGNSRERRAHISSLRRSLGGEDQ
jgi:transcriptional regulator with XRE-family HTH domain